MTHVHSSRPSMSLHGVHRYAEFSDLVLERAQTFALGTEAYDETLLDGAAGRAAESLIDRRTRARDGIFFSGHALGEKVVRYIGSDECIATPIYDPTCGAGDLLIQAAKFLPLGDSVDMTLKQWGARLFGTDLHQIFVETTKRRLTLLAMYRHKDELPGSEILVHSDDYFPNIRVEDFLISKNKFPERCNLLMNPPFLSAPAPSWITWSSGRVQMAGAFLEHAIRKSRPESQVVAILPDVLRSGTRYARWRNMISQYCVIRAVDLYGKFDAVTDVDVFILHLTKRASPKNEADKWPAAEQNVAETCVPLSQLATVTVGAVVPHRHKKRGPWCHYLDVSNAPAFGETEVHVKRRFAGTVVLPPFLVVRRTSNPADKDRLITTVVTGENPVAVENHLVVIKPLESSLNVCRRLAAALKDPNVRRWLDMKIRCRHLTTTLLKDIPIAPERV
ncbi:N-6 DNA methylase [Achromobacter xylosoxidans]|uniref:N-6 DNA methylase n=1 Tax=Alcaligenes xylosoxydans xylosoxydans TaxID=85698 RepID=UPI001EEB45B8|nr:N-6 DNA methylase [Achromobacter xylosoxidans]